MSAKTKGLTTCGIINALFFLGIYAVIRWELNELSNVEDAYIAPITIGMFLVVIPLYLIIYGCCCYELLNEIIRPIVLMIIFLCPLLIWLSTVNWLTIVLFTAIGIILTGAPVILIKWIRHIRSNRKPKYEIFGENENNK